MDKKEEQIRLLIGGSWYKRLSQEFDKSYMTEINATLSKEAYYPEVHDIFRAYMMCPYDEVRVVILGQDPYHDGQANGLAFSTKEKMNPSLRNILAALNDDINWGSFLEHQNNFAYLCERGVLLINSALTVLPGSPGSHSEMWKPFTQRVFEELNKKESPIVFLLWGNHAKGFKKYIDPFKHKVIECEHPAASVYNGKGVWEHRNCFSEAEAFVLEHYGKRYANIW